MFENNVTVDLNNHTYTATHSPVGSDDTANNLFLLEQANTITLQHGTIAVAEQSGAADQFSTVLQNYANLTLDTMTVDGSNLVGTGYTLSNQCGTVLITNSTIIANENGGALNVNSSSAYSQGVSVTVQDSTITGRIQVTSSDSASGDNTPQLNLTGGTLTGGLTADKGGQLYAVGMVSVADVAFTNNTATSQSSAIFNDDTLEAAGDTFSGNGTVLESDGFSQNIWTFPVGVTFSRDFVMDNGWYVKPNLDVSVIPAAGDIDGTDRFRFTGVPVTTSMETQIMDHLTWQGGVGVELGNNDTLRLGVNYILQAGEDVVGHGVFGTFSYKF